VGIPEGNRPLGKTRHRWENNIKCVFEKLKEEARTGAIWLGKRDRCCAPANAAMNHQVL
jgi:hypothetical protein